MTNEAYSPATTALHPSVVALDTISDLIREADRVALTMSDLTDALVFLVSKRADKTLLVICSALNQEIALLIGALLDADARANTGIILGALDDERHS